MNRQLTFYSKDELISHLKSGVPTLYHSSQTSTVIPFESLQGSLNPETVLGNLSMLPGSLQLDKNHNLVVNGFVTWKEAKEFCRVHGVEVMTCPTEELAGVLSGVATSATGERSFGFKNLRSQIVELTYLNFDGVESKLEANKKLPLSSDIVSYQKDFEAYQYFKNAPFPRFEYETDLMTGTEGQLGIITSVTLKTVPHSPETYLFFLLPKWEENFKPHIELFEAVQNLRGKVLACELLDANSLSYLAPDKRVGHHQDAVFLEIRKSDFDHIFEELVSKLKYIDQEEVFEMASSKCRELRMSVPRAIFEVNSKMGVTKKGTDVQVASDRFEDLLTFYRYYTKLGIPYNLFGHFGDAHLHFNFMPNRDQNNFCNDQLENLYREVKEWQGSPFAEHGIGLLKRKYIKNFYNENQQRFFKQLKNVYDPKKQFFMEGFMSC